MINNGGNLEEELQADVDLDTNISEDTDSQNSNEGQFDEKQYKSLQAEFDRRNEDLYSSNIRLAGKDKSSILDMPEYIQKKVIKELYGLDNLNELKQIHGDNFFKDTSTEEEGSDSELSKIKKELKIMKYQSEKSNIESNIHSYIKENGITDTLAIDKFKDEIQYLSNDLSVADRVKRAGKILYGNSSSNNAYLAMQGTQIKSGSNNQTAKKKDAVTETIRGDLRKYFN